MKVICAIFLISALAVTGCKKDNYKYSGTDSINNELFGTGPYYGYGFSVPTGQKISTLENKLDVISLFVDFEVDFTVRKIYLSCNNFEKSFFKYGEYSSEADASGAFDNLHSFSISQWEELGDFIKPHQIWIFRCSDNRYAKIRIISTFTEKRAGMPFPYGECTFEWVFQPDGTETFPGK